MGKWTKSPNKGAEGLRKAKDPGEIPGLNICAEGVTWQA